METTRLRCEYLEDPLAMDAARPRLSWEPVSEEPGDVVSAWRIRAASTPGLLARGRPDLWDTGTVRGGHPAMVPYEGRRLGAFRRCCWQVRAWDRQGRPGPWSRTAAWETGPRRESDWRAKWIACAGTLEPVYHGVPPAPVFRREFSLPAGFTAARAYLCGLGYGELFVNGRRAGDSVLDPAFTRYDRRVLYSAHDVTGLLRPGANAVGVMLGNGWYNAHTRCNWNYDYAAWRDRPKLLLLLRVEFAGRPALIIASNESWRASSGPVVFDGLRNGEVYDARLEMPGWHRPGYDDRAWFPAVVTRPPGGRLEAQKMPPIRVTGTLEPVGVSETAPGVFVYDLGQAFSGWARLTVSGPAGTAVTMRYAERTNQAGVDTVNAAGFIGMEQGIKSGPFQTDTFILKGRGRETYEPRFTYHGFQFVEVRGYPGRPSPADLKGRVVHTDLARHGDFTCSDKTLNRIQHMVLWSTLSNYHGLPTDCPHREKQGWTGDALVSADQVLYNFDAAAAYTKWLGDFRDEQRPSGQLPGVVPTSGWGYNWGSGPAWDSAYTHLPWYLYLYRGDERVLAEHYPGMKRYLEFMGAMATGHIVSFGLGDWCPPREKPAAARTPAAVTSTGYYFANARILARAARLLGRPAEARRFEQLAEKVRRAFLARFYEARTGLVAGGGQTAQACALFHGLLEPEQARPAFAALVDAIEANGRRIDCGILGAKYVMHVLHDYQRDDLAYALAVNPRYPGWGNWVARGANTLWETWEGDDSRIHHMFSDIGAWFYRALAGIEPDPDNPGFRRFRLRPSPVEGLDRVRARHRCPHGLIESAWRRDARGTLTFDFTVPVGTTAEIHLPGRGAFAAGAGRHRFRAAAPGGDGRRA